MTLIRFFKAFVLLVLTSLSLTCTVWAVQGGPKKSPDRPLRLLVTFKPSYLGTVESSLSSGTLQATSATGSRRIVPFLNRHHIKRLEPLHKDWVKRKMQTGKSAEALMQEVQQRFPERSRRFKGLMRPTDLSQHYIVIPDVANESELEALAQTLKQDPQIESVEQERAYQIQLTPNDPYFSRRGTWGQTYDDLWGLKKIAAGAAWDLGTGTGILVAVVDTGIDHTHPDLATNVWTNPSDGSHGYNFVNNTNNPLDDNGHGTHVSGTIAAVGNNSIGVIGVAWGSKVMGIKGLAADGNGYTSVLAQGIRWAVDHGADVINMSWAGPGPADPVLDSALAYAYNQGVVLVAAAGNNALDVRGFYPASSRFVITVSAISELDFITNFSNVGYKIDVAAPGVGILSLQAVGTALGPVVAPGYIWLDGTSMATPHVAGLAALILSQHPTYSNEQVRSTLRSSADDLGPVGFDVYYGYGRINAQRALSVGNALEAKIESPAFGTAFQAMIPATVYGLANGPNFASYTLEHGAGESPTVWTVLNQSATPANHSALGVFDPRVVPDGPNTIRLTVTDTNGNVSKDQTQFIVDYVSISDPAPPATPNTARTIKAGISLPISGVAVGGSFQYYTVEWARGISPFSGWSSAGITLTQGGRAPLVKAVLANWATDEIHEAGFYTLRLTVQNQGYTSLSDTLIYLEPDLASTHWPQRLQGVPYGGVLPALGANTTVRFVLQSPPTNVANARYWSFPYDGSTQSTFELSFGSYHQPAIADLDRSAGEEVMIGEVGSLSFIRPDQSLYRISPPGNLDFRFFQPVIQDLDGNGTPEILAMGADTANNISYLFAWKSDGSLLTSQFPIPVPGLYAPFNRRPASQVLAVDLDSNGSKEIVVASIATTPSASFTLKVYNADGTARVGWQSFTAAGRFNTIVAADLEHDGAVDLLLSYIDTSLPPRNKVSILLSNGSVKTGWPVTINSSEVGGLGIADMDKDGKDEIVFCSLDTLHVLKSNATPFSSVWPKNVLNAGKQLDSFSIADLNADGFPEILVNAQAPNNYYFPSPSSSSDAALPASPASGSPSSAVQTVTRNVDGQLQLQVSPQGPQAQNVVGTLYATNNLEAYKSDGSQLKSWRLPGLDGYQSLNLGASIIGDFNQDGKTDIAVNYYLQPAGGIGLVTQSALLVLSLDSAFNKDSADWPISLHDPQNTATNLLPLLPICSGQDCAGAPVRTSQVGDTVCAGDLNTWQCTSNGYVNTGASCTCGTTNTNALPQGHLELANCSRLSGWAFDRDTPNTTLAVHIYDGSTFLMSANTTVVRADINSLYAISGAHGFSIATPTALKDGAPHSVRVDAIDTYGGTNTLLQSTPIALTCAPPLDVCDLDQNGPTNVIDVQLAVIQAIGRMPCTTGDIDLNHFCNVIDVQRVANHALGGPCVSP